LYEAILAEATSNVSAEVIDAAKGAAAIMGMNNVYYRFQHIVENPRYTEIPARLRMNILRGHKGDPVDFELWSLAVSAINGCGKCVSSHERVLRSKGVAEDAIVAAVRIASVLSAVAGVLTIETPVELASVN
jgi:alkyl hydroperoxide reductase subunit D